MLAWFLRFYRCERVKKARALHSAPFFFIFVVCSRVVYLFCSRGFKCSGPLIVIETVIWAALKKVADHWFRSLNARACLLGGLGTRSILGITAPKRVFDHYPEV